MLAPAPRSSSRGHTLPLALLMLLLGVAACLWWWHHATRHPPVIAKVGTAAIGQRDLALALRDSLWRQHLRWEDLDSSAQSRQRQLVLNQLIDLKLASEALQQPSNAGHDDREFQQFIKQFETPEAWQQRAAGQHLTETQLRERISSESSLSLALEQTVLKNHPKPSEADTQAWFDRHQDRFILPARVRASHLFLSIHDQEKPDREGEIRALYQRLLNGESPLSQLARQFSEDPRTKNRGGELGWFSRERVAADFAERVFALKPGQMSEPFLTGLGWHIVLLHEKQAARPAAFSSVKDEILAHLEDQTRRQAIAAWLNSQRAAIPIEIDAEMLGNAAPEE